MTKSRLCNFTKADGSPCRASAVGRARHCRPHSRQAARDHRRTLALNPGRTVRLGLLETRPGIQHALNRVMQLVAAGTLPPHRARLALSRIRLALAELDRGSAIELDAASIRDIASTPASHLAYPPEPRTLNPEPGHDLPSPSAAPTIVKTPAIRRSSQLAVQNQSHRQSSQGPAAYQNRPPSTDNVQPTTDNART